MLVRVTGKGESSWFQPDASRGLTRKHSRWRRRKMEEEEERVEPVMEGAPLESLEMWISSHSATRWVCVACGGVEVAPGQGGSSLSR